jgi:predicted GTPase
MFTEVSKNNNQPQEASRPLRVTTIGGAGVGKSTLGNVLLTGRP